MLTLADVTQQARTLKREAYAIMLAMRDPRVPWHARALAGCVAAYALSPIDLIPDVIPILGLLDDLVLVPLGIRCVLRMIPPAVLAEHREHADALLRQGKLPVSRIGAAAILLCWVLLAWWLVTTAWRMWGR